MTQRVAQLQKQRKVLDYLGAGTRGHAYGYTDDDTDEDVTVLNLSTLDFGDFGQPKNLTVTIQPGDLLNG